MNDVPLPLVVPLNALTEGGVRTGETPDATLRRCLHTALRQRGCEGIVADYFVKRAHEDRVWLFLDALDEAGDEVMLTKFWEALKEWQCHVIILSRPYGYEGRRLPFDVVEYRLAPFSPEQARTFVGKWEGEAPAEPIEMAPQAHRPSRMNHLLAHNPSVQQISQSPFLLTLLCWVVERHEVPDDITRTQLYDRMVLDVLGLPPNGAGKVDEERARRWLPVLSDVAFTWFCDYNAGRRPIPSDQLIRLIAEHQQRPVPLDDETGQPMKVSELKNLTPAQQADYLLDELRRKRLLVPATDKPATDVVPHRSILEYLTACALARQLPGLARRHCSYYSRRLAVCGQKGVAF